MNNFFVKAGFSKLKDSELVIKTSTIIGCISGNNHFLEPKPSISQMMESLEEFQERLTILPSGNKADTVSKNQSRTKLQKLLKVLSNYVNAVADGDHEVLFSSGFPVSDYLNKRNSQTPSIPMGGKLTDGRLTGEMRFDFIPVKDVLNYLYRCVPVIDGEVDWGDTVIPTTSSRNNVIGGLTRGVEYHVQVRAVNSAGFGDWSESVKQIAR